MSGSFYLPGWVKTDDIVIHRIGRAFSASIFSTRSWFLSPLCPRLGPTAGKRRLPAPAAGPCARNTSWRSFRTRSSCCSPPPRSSSCSPVTTSTSLTRKPFSKPWWCGCVTTSRIDSRTWGCFWPLSGCLFFLHRWGSRRRGIEITLGTAASKQSCHDSSLSSLFIKILFFAVNKPREQIPNAFLFFSKLFEYLCRICVALYVNVGKLWKSCLQKFPEPVMSYIQFMLIERDKGSKQMLFSQEAGKPNAVLSKHKHSH